MDSRFASLRQRDASVSMLRVKMSRRRSQSQKENRERVLNTRRQLEKLQEMEMSCLDASIAVGNMSVIQEKTQKKGKPATTTAVEERLKQLERWKERKALEKEKEKRDRERKGVFKTGLYHPKEDLTIVPLPVIPGAPAKPKEKTTVTSENTRVTRSMKQQQKPLKMHDPNAGAKKVQPAVERSTRTRMAAVKLAPAPTTTKAKVCAVEPVVRALSTRSANRPPVTATSVVKDKPKDKAADGRTTRSRAIVNPVAPSSGRERNRKVNVNNNINPTVVKESELNKPQTQEPEDKPCSEEEDMVVDKAPEETVPAVDPTEPQSSLSSFAPDGFVFHAPAGLSNFKFEPLTPRSADAFLTPSSSFNLPPALVLSAEPQDESNKPICPESPHRSPPRTSPAVASPTPGSPLESKHDVPYFRSEIANETDRLMSLCSHWESKVEDESIPEEMRDRMRTAVGQARLLMKERFKQFGGLVDDCELGRGEKITTCTDLQGFWDMVYYQVEDVNKKFDALREAEGRGWVEEHKPPPRQRKMVKKASAAPVKPTVTKAAAKSRLAAVKAAMKAKQQAAEAEKAAGESGGNTEEDAVIISQEPKPQAGAQTLDAVVFDGGFFKVESPAKPLGSVRRSSRLSAAVLPQASPCSTYLSPRRVTRRSLALSQTPVHTSPAHPVHIPVPLRLALEQTPAPRSQCGTPQPPQSRSDAVNTSLCFSPVKEVLTEDTRPEGSLDETASTQETTACIPIMGTPIILPPAISVVEESDKPAEGSGAELPLSLCNIPPHVSQTPEPSSALSFILTPNLTPAQPPISSAAVQDQQSVCHTPDSSIVEEIPGLDFERYLQPSQRCSLSPMETVSKEMSPMAVDLEMESPRVEPDVLSQQEPDGRVCPASLHPGPEGQDTPVCLPK
ncbi:disks large-associated protein 5 isoform X2 [Mugil cephalus]|uniref:disks large-associated protein 5 isoform X2 n=1 Tax=Mugil cephalus TaxID=48193 RepID=UPI001FB7FBF2|nr:disks large-associated protein 5 isoform X2 [Mugil cephalus]